jgi:hypothetical protein
MGGHVSSPTDRELDEGDLDVAPPANKGLLAVAGVLLLIPIVALMWVTTYNKEEPRLAGFPFFIWYQFLWVFLCSAMTWTAYLLVLRARPHRPIRTSGPAIGDERDRDAFDGDLGNDEGGAR